jgi:hypothetical protein
MKKHLFAMMMAAVAWAASPANAALVTIEPDDYAVGTNLTRTLQDVSLFSFVNTRDGGLRIGDVVVAEANGCDVRPDDCYAVTGSRIFGRDGDPNPRWWDSPGAHRCFESLFTNPCSRSVDFFALLISFDTPTDYVEISGNFTADHPLIYLYDESRNLIGAHEARVPWERGSTYTTSTALFQSSSANVAYMVAAGWAAGTSLDVLRYNDVNVPEPGTALLFSVALAGMALLRRRRAH